MLHTALTQKKPSRCLSHPSSADKNHRSAEAGSALSDEEARARAGGNVDSGKAADKSFLGANNNLPYGKLNIGSRQERTGLEN